MDLNIDNLALIEENYARYRKDPNSIEPSWRYFFEGVDFGGLVGAGAGQDRSPQLRVFNLILAYRRYGHLLAPINPIATEARVHFSKMSP